MNRKPLSQLRNDNRGQVILLAAFAMVLVLLSTMMIFNVAAFTDLQRADGVEEYGLSTQQALTQIEYSLETTVDHTNIDTTISTQAGRESHIQDDAAKLDTRLSRQFAREGESSTISHSTMTFNHGVRVWQNEFGNFQQAGGPCGSPPCSPLTDYTLVDNANNVRAFTIEATGDGLNTNKADAFHVNITLQDGSFKNVTIFEGPGGDLVVEDESGNQCSVFSSFGTPARIGFSAGTLNDQHCDALPGTESIEDIRFENTNQVDGKLQLVIDGGDANVPEFTTQASPSANTGNIEAHEAVYSTTVAVTVQTQHSSFSATIRVVPGLPLEAQTG